MKKLIFICTLLAYTSVLFAQTKDYRTTEDGMNKLINNPDFINDVVKLGTEPLTLEKLDSYFAKYVPEYSNFKIDNSKIDFNNLYYVNSEGVSNELIANKLGSLLKLKPNETQNLKNILTGNISYTQASGLSTGLGNELYERGKDKNVDYVVDYSTDFFQNKLGDGGTNSTLIDIGGGLLGAALTELNKKYYEKLAEQERVALLVDDHMVYLMGSTSFYDQSTKKYISGSKPEQKDLFTHHLATKKMANSTAYSFTPTDYTEAIKLLNQSIALYRQNADRAYYLYLAYVDRALCKMKTGAYRGAIIDYYFAQGVLENILKGTLKDKSVYFDYPIGFFDIQNKSTYFKGKVETKFAVLNNKDIVIMIINRSFAKYRAGDYKGAIGDAEFATQRLVNKNIPSSGKPNDYKDVIKAIVAMSQFGLEKYTASYTTFSNANLDDDLFADKDNDGVTNFLDTDDEGSPGYVDKAEGYKKTEYYGLPNYFPFDIAQIKGMAYYKAGKLDAAIGIYENILTAENSGGKKTFTKIGGDVTAVYSTLGSFYFTKGDQKKAIKLLDEAIKLNPNQLEYYYKRGTYKKSLGQIKEANADFAIVKNPALLKVANAKKSSEYYETKYAEFTAANKLQEQYLLVKEAMLAYPEMYHYFMWLIKNLSESKNRSNANEMSELLINDPKKHHLLKSLYYEYLADNQNEEKEMFLAFDNGLGLYESSTMYQLLNLLRKPYYCRLLTKYVSPTNNNFIPPNFDKAQMAKMLDSLNAASIETYKTNKIMLKVLNDQRKLSQPKALGNYEEYLAVLNSNSMLLNNMSALHALDKIECLFILNRRAEAIKFAKQVWAKGKLMKPMDEVVNPFYKMTNSYYYAIENMANGSCD